MSNNIDNLVHNIIFAKNFISFTFVISVFVLLNVIQANYFAPLLPFDADTLFKMKWVLSKNYISEDGSHQHYLRWGSYIIFYFIDNFFNFNFVSILITSLIIYSAAGIIFIYFVHFNFGFFFSLIFLFFWLTNISINNEMFSLSINTISLFFLSILVILLSKINIAKENPFTYAFSISLVLFLLFAVKETNIFYFLLLIFIREFYTNLKLILYIIIIIITFYIIETIFLFYFSNFEIRFGRIFSYLKIDHIADMKSGYLTGGNTSGMLILERFFSPFYRWYITSTSNTVIFYTAVVLSSFGLFSSKNNKISIDYKFIYLLVLSFFLFTTFFLISLSPPIMGQPHEPRFLITLLPLSFIVIIIFLHLSLKNSKNISILLVILIIILFTFLSKPTYKLVFEDQKFSLAAVKNNYNNSYKDRLNTINDFFENLSYHDCIEINEVNHHIAKILFYRKVLTGKSDYVDGVNSPLKENKFDHVTTFNWVLKSIPDKNGKVSIWYRKDFKVKKDDTIKCSKTIFLNNNSIIFY